MANSLILWNVQNNWFCFSQLFILNEVESGEFIWLIPIKAKEECFTNCNVTEICTDLNEFNWFTSMGQP